MFAFSQPSQPLSQNANVIFDGVWKVESPWWDLGPESQSAVRGNLNQVLTTCNVSAKTPRRTSKLISGFEHKHGDSLPRSSSLIEVSEAMEVPDRSSTPDSMRSSPRSIELFEYLFEQDGSSTVKKKTSTSTLNLVPPHFVFVFCFLFFFFLPFFHSKKWSTNELPTHVIVIIFFIFLLSLQRSVRGPKTMAQYVTSKLKTNTESPTKPALSSSKPRTMKRSQSAPPAMIPPSKWLIELLAQPYTRILLWISLDVSFSFFFSFLIVILFFSLLRNLIT